LLFKFDLNAKSILTVIEVPKAIGVTHMEYSPANKHLFLRSYVCCSCGFERADLGTSCPDNIQKMNVTVSTGPNLSDGVPGVCGEPCEGSPADTLGVYEYDTVSGKFLITHVDTAERAADPYVDPSGQFVILIPNDGDVTLSILGTRENGEVSSLLANTIQTGFPTDKEKKAIYDVCFVQSEYFDVVVFTSNLSEYVVITNLYKLRQGIQQVDSTKIYLSSMGDEFQPGESKRSCAWAFGANVWISTPDTGDIHIIDLNEEKVTKQFVFENPMFMRWIYNHRAKALAESVLNELSTGIIDAIPISEDNPPNNDVPSSEDVPSSDVPPSNNGGNSDSGTLPGATTNDIRQFSKRVDGVEARVQGLELKVSNQNAGISVAQANIVGLTNSLSKLEYDMYEDEDDGGIDWDKMVGPAGLALGLFAVILGLVNLVIVCKKPMTINEPVELQANSNVETKGEIS